MSVLGVGRFGVIGGLAACAVCAVWGAALFSGPIAHADDIATLPLLPFDPLAAEYRVLTPPAAVGVSQTPPESSTIPFGHETQFDDTYVLTGGNFDTHTVEDIYAQPEEFFEQDSQVVTASDGVAPPVGTEWDQSYGFLPSWGYSLELYAYSSMTTPAGTVDVFTPENIPAFLAYSNEYYNGPAGIFDDLVSANGATVIPIIDLPADPSAAGAAADFATLWSELTTTI